MVKAAEYGHHCNAMVLRNAMPFALKLRLRKVGVRNSRSQTGVRSRRVVMNYPLFHDPPDVVFVDGKHEIQTFSTGAADQPLAECIGFGQPIWGPQYSQSQGSE